MGVPGDIACVTAYGFLHVRAVEGVGGESAPPLEQLRNATILFIIINGVIVAPPYAIIP